MGGGGEARRICGRPVASSRVCCAGLIEDPRETTGAEVKRRSGRVGAQATMRSDLKAASPSVAALAADAERLARNAKRAADLLKALAHENRLMILCILSQGEKSVSELEQMLSLRQPTVSQQLARLRADGLVTTRRDGKTIHYSLTSEEARVVLGAVYAVFCGPA
jgi:ArsR family transcriptional regulator, virulence genes transcriptional regulator